jgi:acyl-coenzyme A synthetase/AMP-(fatty) acid ligase
MRLTSQRTLIYGAAPIAPIAVEWLITAFGQIFIQGYGATEILMGISTLTKRAASWTHFLF